jgi:hypothetical protein
MLIQKRDPLMKLARLIPAKLRAEIEGDVSVQVEETVKKAIEAEPQTIEEFEAVAACQIA